MLELGWVFLGGGLGSICRLGIAKIIQPYQVHFPWATWTANIISCIVLGILMALVNKGQFGSPAARLLLMTGFCGGFSTFSTFTGEALTLFQNGQNWIALVYVTTSILVCLGCMMAGMWLVEKCI